VARRRLRDPLAPADYQVVRDNFVWADHVLRLLATAGAVAWLAPETVMDPACGDASIVTHAYKLRPFRKAYLNDLSVPQVTLFWGTDMGYRADLTAGEALDAIEAFPPVDAMVLTEILEHVEDPDELVAAARKKARHLVVSSPIDEQPGVNNHEHVWAWDVIDYRQMLEAAGWSPVALNVISFPSSGYPYTYQLWVCR
jgi:hypothetical protein